MPTEIKRKILWTYMRGGNTTAQSYRRVCVRNDSDVPVFSCLWSLVPVSAPAPARAAPAPAVRVDPNSPEGKERAAAAANTAHLTQANAVKLYCLSVPQVQLLAKPLTHAAVLHAAIAHYRDYATFAAERTVRQARRSKLAATRAAALERKLYPELAGWLPRLRT